jgi:hypothetical protein
MMPIAVGIRRHNIATFDVVRSVVGGGRWWDMSCAVHHTAVVADDGLLMFDVFRR